MGKVKSDDARLTDFKLLSFDVYSTLIDEKGMHLLYIDTTSANIFFPQNF